MCPVQRLYTGRARVWRFVLPPFLSLLKQNCSRCLPAGVLDISIAYSYNCRPEPGSGLGAAGTYLERASVSLSVCSCPVTPVMRP